MSVKPNSKRLHVSVLFALFCLVGLIIYELREYSVFAALFIGFLIVENWVWKQSVSRRPVPRLPAEPIVTETHYHHFHHQINYSYQINRVTEATEMNHVDGITRKVTRWEG